MPDFFYSIDILARKKKLISIVMVDTIKLCGNTKFSMNPFSTSDKNTPFFESDYDEKMAATYLKQVDKILQTKSNSNVPYLVVGGHYPVFSVSEHGPTDCLVKQLMPLLQKYKVSAYISGHDHNLQHLSYTKYNHTVEYMVTGANSLNTASTAHLYASPNVKLKFQWPTKSELIFGGFIMLQASQQNMTTKFIKADGTLLYETTIQPRS